MVSYHIFDEISKTVPSVQMRLANFFFDKPVEEVPGEFPKMTEIEKSGVRGFFRDSDLIKKHKVNQDAGVVDSYAHLSPMIDTTAYLVCVLVSFIRPVLFIC